MLFNKETISNFIDSKGISEIEDDGYRVISQDLEYTIKELCQEAYKFMVASHRTRLTVNDINNALISRNVEPLFGHETKDILVFKRLPSGSFYAADEEIDLEEFLEKPLPKIPLRPYVQSHWLVVEGVQPPIQQNPIIINKPVQKKDDFSDYQEEMKLKKQVKHRLTKELNMYFEKIIQAMNSEPKIAMECLENETGIQQLVPYFIHHFNTELRAKISESERVKTICLMYFSLLKNKFLFIDPYLHEILPSIITCIVGKSVTEDVRLLAADILKYAYDTYSYTYQTLAPRMVNSFLKVLEDDNKSEDSQWGALYALSRLSEEVIKAHIICKPCPSNKTKVLKLYDEIKSKYQ